MTVVTGSGTLAARMAAAEMVEPATLAQARDAVTGAATVLFLGAGTKIDWGSPPERIDRVIATDRLDRLRAHDPGDLTATVEAGMPLTRLQSLLIGHGQWLALDPPSEAGGATVGGLLATGDAGPRRQRYGTLRDLVIGVTAILSDGAVSRSGGQVIKNVAGYDLAKVLCGSLGTLGLVVEVTVRLHPLPAASATLRAQARPEAAAVLALALLAAPLEPVALDWFGDPGGGPVAGTGAPSMLLVRFEGRAEAVDEQIEAARGLARELGATDVDRIDADEQEAAWHDVARALGGSDGETVVRAATLPSELPQAARSLALAAEGAGVSARLHSHAGLGVHTARLSGGSALDHARAVEVWRAALQPLGGHAVVRRRVEGVDQSTDVWGPPPPSFGLMRGLKQQFDPERRCVPGRYVGGL